MDIVSKLGILLSSQLREKSILRILWIVLTSWGFLLRSTSYTFFQIVPHHICQFLSRIAHVFYVFSSLSTLSFWHFLVLVQQKARLMHVLNKSVDWDPISMRAACFKMKSNLFSICVILLLPVPQNNMTPSAVKPDTWTLRLGSDPG